MTYFWYSFGSTFTKIYIRFTFNISITYQYESVCRYAPGMSMVDTYIYLCASTDQAIIIVYRDTDGDYDFFDVWFSTICAHLSIDNEVLSLCQEN